MELVFVAIVLTAIYVFFPALTEAFGADKEITAVSLNIAFLVAFVVLLLLGWCSPLERLTLLVGSWYFAGWLDGRRAG